MGLQTRLPFAMTEIGGVLYFVFNVATCVAVAWIMYNLIEKPTLRLASHFRPRNRDLNENGLVRGLSAVVHDAPCTLADSTASETCIRP